MKEFLHKLWCGDIAPGSELSANYTETAELTQFKNRHREKLLDSFTEEQAKWFADYEACEEERDWLTQEDAFTEGVRFAVRLMVEALG